MPTPSRPSTRLFQKSTPLLHLNPSKAIFGGKALEQADMATVQGHYLEFKLTPPTVPPSWGVSLSAYQRDILNHAGSTRPDSEASNRGGRQ